jgi:hypothetical protein
MLAIMARLNLSFASRVRFVLMCTLQMLAHVTLGTDMTSTEGIPPPPSPMSPPRLSMEQLAPDSPSTATVASVLCPQPTPWAAVSDLPWGLNVASQPHLFGFSFFRQVLIVQLQIRAPCLLIVIVLVARSKMTRCTAVICRNRWYF